MMSSRSIASTVKLFAVALVAALTLIALPTPASAGKKLVILEFEGPKAEKFRSDVEALIKKGNTLVSLDKWQAKAEDLGAEKVNAKNVKKIAAKLKVDGVIQGDVEKRGSRYYIHLKLREGRSGDYVAEVEIVVRSPKLGSDGAKIVKDELLPAIKELSGSGKGDDDEDDDDDDADDEDKPKKGKTKKSGFGRKGRGDDEDEDEDADAEDDDEDADDEDEDPPAKKKTKKTAKTKKTKKAKKPEPEPEPEDDEDEDADSDEDDDSDDGDDEDRVAASDDDEDSDDGELRRGDDDDDDGGGAIDPRWPAVDVGAGLSVTQRKLGFTTAAGAGPVQGYKGNMVAGAMVDASVYPLALNKKNKSITRNVGITILLDRVVKIESRLPYDNMGTEEVAVLATKQSRYAAGLVYRHAVNDQIIVQGQLRYNRMKFVINRDDVPAGVTVQIPNVNYTFVDPGVSVRYASSPKLMFGAGAAFLFVMNTGDMQEAEQYGAAKVSGFDLDAGADYVLAPRIIVSAEARYTTFGFTFDGSGALSDPNADGNVDVPKGSDSYLGAAVTASYLF